MTYIGKDDLPQYFIVNYSAQFLKYSDRGWGNGYVIVSKNHPWYGLHYDKIDAEIHGGLTFAGVNISGQPQESKTTDAWIVGFDTGHSTDNINNCPKEYVELQAKWLLIQAIDAYKNKRKYEKIN